MKRGREDLGLMEDMGKKTKEDQEEKVTSEAFYHQKQSELSGKISFPNGDCFEGEIQNGLPIAGCMSYKDNTKFVGTFSEGQPNSGEYSLASGDTFSGTFKNGLPSQGRIMFKSGELFQGEVLSGNLLVGVMVFPSEDLFIGLLSDRKPIYGRLIPNSGASKYGQFAESLPEGLNTTELDRRIETLCLKMGA